MLPHLLFDEDDVFVNKMPMLDQGGTYFIDLVINDINVDEWHHFCGGSSVLDMRTNLFVIYLFFMIDCVKQLSIF